MTYSLGFDIFARDRASKEFDKVGRAAQLTGSKLDKVGKAAALALGGAAVGGVLALGAAMVHGVKDAADYQALGLKTAAVLKSTGNVAHQSVAGIQARAAALESLSGVDETTIINGQNVLATFTKVRDGVGKGNDIFNQATTAALNMSTALGTDLQGSTIQLGKALNDPIKGVTALQRVGVSFTQAQKDQIKTMVESGDTMGAQKLILGELNTEFGGAAKAAGQGFGGAMARARDSIDDAFRSIGIKLLPTLTKMADYVAANAGPAIDRLSVFMTTRLIPAISTVVAYISRFVTDFQRGAGSAGLLRSALEIMGAVIVKVTGFLRAHSTIVGAVVTGLLAAFVAFKIVTTAVKIFALANAALNLVLSLNPIGIVILALVALAVGLTYAYKHSETFRIICQAAFKAVGAAATWMWNNAIAPALRFIIGGFVTVISTFAKVLHALGKVPGFDWAEKAARKLDGMAAAARVAGAAIKNIPTHKSSTIALHITGLHALQQARVLAEMRAGGGPVRKGMPYWVGEGGPELVFPDGNGTVLNARGSAALRAGQSGRAAGMVGGGGDIHIHLSGNFLGNSDQLARELHRAFLKLKNESRVPLGLA